MCQFNRPLQKDFLACSSCWPYSSMVSMIFMLKHFRQKHLKTIKAFFSSKRLSSNNIMAAENNEIVREVEKLAKIINDHFTNIIIYLKVKPTKNGPKPNFESIIDSFQNSKSIQRIMLAMFNPKSPIIIFSTFLMVEQISFHQKWRRHH